MTANAFRSSGRLRLFVAVTGIALLEASCGQQSDSQTQSTRTLNAPSLHEATEDRRIVRGQREPLDDAAVEAEVVKRAKPAEVKFDVATKMAMGQVYEAKLEILRSGGGKASLITDTPELIERVQILNKVRATISSAHLKIERLLPEWQEIPTGGRGYWTWKIEPQKKGKTELLVLVEHAGAFDNRERIFNVEQFPRTIEIEVGFWEGVQEAITGVSPSITAVSGIVAGLAGIAGIGAGAWTWIRGRRRRGEKGDGDSHEASVT